MSKIAKLFRNGNSQAVRLPHDMRFKGDEVRIRKVGDTLVLEPMIADVKEWFAAIDRHGKASMFPKGWRKQPPAPKRKIFE
jgi:antitoxin VapB